MTASSCSSLTNTEERSGLWVSSATYVSGPRAPAYRATVCPSGGSNSVPSRSTNVRFPGRNSVTAEVVGGDSLKAIVHASVFDVFEEYVETHIKPAVLVETEPHVS